MEKSQEKGIERLNLCRVADLPRPDAWKNPKKRELKDNLIDKHYRGKIDGCMEKSQEKGIESKNKTAQMSMDQAMHGKIPRKGN